MATQAYQAPIDEKDVKTDPADEATLAYNTEVNQGSYKGGIVSLEHCVTRAAPAI